MKARIVGISAMLVMLGGLIAPSAMASTASQGALAVPAVSGTHVQNAFTTGLQGNISGWLYDTGNTGVSFSYQGKVCGSCSWPFKAGSGLNDTYNGNNVYVVYGVNSGSCWQISANKVQYQSGVCGGTHWYSFWVQAGAPDGSGSSEGWVNVGQSNAAGRGQYMETTGVGAIAILANFAASSKETYTVF